MALNFCGLIINSLDNMSLAGMIEAAPSETTSFLAVMESKSAVTSASVNSGSYSDTTIMYKTMNLIIEKY